MSLAASSVWKYHRRLVGGDVEERRGESSDDLWNQEKCTRLDRMLTDYPGDRKHWW
jgi:hypothetical protein